jgi:hypothetical protein
MAVKVSKAKSLATYPVAKHHAFVHAVNLARCLDTVSEYIFAITILSSNCPRVQHRQKHVTKSQPKPLLVRQRVDKNHDF